MLRAKRSRPLAMTARNFWIMCTSLSQKLNYDTYVPAYL